MQDTDIQCIYRASQKILPILWCANSRQYSLLHFTGSVCFTETSTWWSSCFSFFFLLTQSHCWIVAKFYNYFNLSKIWSLISVLCSLPSNWIMRFRIGVPIYRTRKQDWIYSRYEKLCWTRQNNVQERGCVLITTAWLNPNSLLRACSISLRVNNFYIPEYSEKCCSTTSSRRQKCNIKKSKGKNHIEEKPWIFVTINCRQLETLPTLVPLLQTSIRSGNRQYAT